MEYGYAEAELVGSQGTANLRLRVPCTWPLMQRGLQGPASMCMDEGMLFASQSWPREEPIAMWMATVKFPLAMIWVDAKGRVVDVQLAESGDPATYEHRGLYVIEANAALAVEIGLLPGDRVKLAMEDACPRLSKS